MKKTLFIIIILFLISIFVHIPKYIELNDLIIIDKISIDCSKNKIYYREIIPYKDNNTISYKYKIHNYKYKNINDFFNKNNIYYKNVRRIYTNCDNFDNKYNFKIIYKNKINKELN